MHSLKNLSLKKNDLKLSPEAERSSPIKVQDGRDDLIGMTVKNTKLSIPHQTSWTKSVYKSDFIDAKSALLQQKQPLKKLGKRKEGNIRDNEKKKRKSVFKLEDTSGSDNTKLKKNTKPKSVYRKTAASFVCKYCCRGFHSTELLRDHTSTHGSNPSYVCYVCGTEAGAFSSLMAHFVKHPRTNNNQDEKCVKNKIDCNSIEFPSSSLPKSAIRCSHCKISFPSTEKLAAHYCSIAGQKSEYNCAYCGQVSVSVDDYRLHVLSHSVTPFLCMHCNFKGPTKKLLDRHNEVCKKRPKKSNESLIFKCKICSLECKHRKELNQHSKMCKQTSNCKITLKNCSNCDSVFSNKVDFDNHMLTCRITEKYIETTVKVADKGDSTAKVGSVQEETFLCFHCGEIFDTQTDHENHQQICFEEDQSTLNEKTSILCPTCGDMFHTATIEEHQKHCLQSHDTTCKDFDEVKEDSDTDSPSKRRSARLVTRKSNGSEKCSKSKDIVPKKRKTNIQEKKIFKKKTIKDIKGRRGRQSKLGSEDFKCIYCDLTFCSKSTLLRHKRMHSGNPYFSCKYCGKFFFRKDVYTRHEVNVHSKSTKSAFCCYYCKLYFADPLALKEHVFAVHKENAFLPVKPEMSREINTETQLLPLEIKKEPENSESKTHEKCTPKNITSVKNDILNSVTLSLSSSPYKKCGTCLESFENMADIEKHMLSHQRTEDSYSASETFLKNPQTAQIADEKNNRTSKSTSKQPGNTDSVFPINNKLNSSTSVSSPKKCSVSSLQNQDKETCIQSPDLNKLSSPSSDLNELNSPEDISPKESKSETGSYVCKLCLKKYASQSLLTSHETSEEHRIMDWYQCLVCNISGPRQDMIEHMFAHMYKVGTFVISKASNDIGPILPYSKSLDINVNGSALGSVEDKNDSDNIPMEVIDEVIDYELPLLTDYGMDIPNFSGCAAVDVETCSINKKQSSDSDKIKNTCSDIVESSYLTEENNGLFQRPLQNEDPSSPNDCIHSKHGDNINLSSENSEDVFLVTPKTLPGESLPLTLNSFTTTASIYLTGESCISSKESLKETCKTSNPESSLPIQSSVPDNIKIGEEIANKSGELLDEYVADNTNFSRLRYLLETSKKGSPEASEGFDRETDEPNSHLIEKACEQPNYVQLCNLLNNIPQNDSSNNKDSLSWLNSLQTDEQQLKEMPDSKVIQEKLHAEPLFKGIDDFTSFNKLVLDSNETLLKKQPAANRKSVLKQQELNHGVNTCLNFDINQSRGEFSENLDLVFQTQNHEDGSKLGQTDLFQTTHVESKILDFSDLLKIGDSINASEDNIFQCDDAPNIPSSSYQPSIPSNSYTSNVPSSSYISNVYNSTYLAEIPSHAHTANVPTGSFTTNLSSSSYTTNLSNSSYTTNLSSNPHTINLPSNPHTTNLSSSSHTTNMSSSTFTQNTPKANLNVSCNSVKNQSLSDLLNCNNCHREFSGVSEMTLHNCSKNVTIKDRIKSTYKSESNNSFASPPNKPESPSTSDIGKPYVGKHLIQNTVPAIFKPNDLKSSHNRAMKKYHTCSKCYRTFKDIKECAKHSLSCWKPGWYKSNHASDALKFPETLHSLLSKGEARTQQHNYSTSSESDNSTMDNSSYDGALNLSKSSFNS